MGVSGCGKTTVGTLLARELSLPFYDADVFHPAANVAKMKSGTPLTDADREPWLRSLAQHIGRWEKTGGAILACSALKEAYRETLRSKATAAVRFVYLKGDKELIRKRMETRKGHHMPPTLLDSQYATLEEPADALTIVVNDKTPEEMAQFAAEQLGQQAADLIHRAFSAQRKPAAGKGQKPAGKGPEPGGKPPAAA
jgi:carbohydrate kinase (thermoresistant glucokinase family)